MNEIAQKLIKGSHRPNVHERISVGVNRDLCHDVAVVVTNVILRDRTPESLGVTRQQLIDYHALALEACVCHCIDPDAKCNFRRVPVYFDSILHALTTRVGRYILFSEMDDCAAPDYPGFGQTVEMALLSLGVTCVNTRRLSPLVEDGGVLCVQVDSIDGVDTIVGHYDNVKLEEIVLGSLLKLKAEEQTKFQQIVGNLEYQYGSVSDLTLSYFIAQAATVVGD